LKLCQNELYSINEFVSKSIICTNAKHIIFVNNFEVILFSFSLATIVQEYKENDTRFFTSM